MDFCGTCEFAREKRFDLNLKKDIWRCFGTPPSAVVVQTQQGPGVVDGIHIRVGVFADTPACAVYARTPGPLLFPATGAPASAMPVVTMGQGEEPHIRPRAEAA